MQPSEQNISNDSLPSGNPGPNDGSSSWSRFWFKPGDPVVLHGLRICTGLFLLTWLLGFFGHHGALFGSQGWIDERAWQDVKLLPGGPPTPIGWSPMSLVTGPWMTHAVYGLSLTVLVLFTLGVCTRVTSILTWLVVVAFTQNPAMSFGGDALLLVVSFYLMAAYVCFGMRCGPRTWRKLLLGDRGTWLAGRGGSQETAPSVAATACVRMLQVHLAIVLFTSGMHKLQSSVWWAGVALWFPLHRPFETQLDAVLALQSSAGLYMTLLGLSAYAVLAWQLSFPFLAWRKGWYKIYLAAAIVAWIGNRFVYGLPIFGPSVFIGTLAFLPPSSWHRIFDTIGSFTLSIHRTLLTKSAQMETANVHPKSAA